jgi:hypothetical protein
MPLANRSSLVAGSEDRIEISPQQGERTDEEERLEREAKQKQTPPQSKNKHHHQRTSSPYPAWTNSSAIVSWSSGMAAGLAGAIVLKCCMPVRNG